MIEPIPHILKPRLGFLATAFKQIDNSQVQIGNIPIVAMALVKFFQAIAASVELAFVEERAG
jgi:hypothetical protein